MIFGTPWPLQILKNTIESKTFMDPRNSSTTVPMTFGTQCGAQQTVRNVMAATRCAVFVFKRVCCIQFQPLPRMMWPEWSTNGSWTSLPSSSPKNIALHLEEGLALVSDDSENTRKTPEGRSATFEGSGFSFFFFLIFSFFLFDSIFSPFFHFSSFVFFNFYFLILF